MPVRVSKEYLPHDEDPVVGEPDWQNAGVGQRVAHKKEGQREQRAHVAQWPVPARRRPGEQRREQVPYRAVWI